MYIEVLLLFNISNTFFVIPIVVYNRPIMVVSNNNTHQEIVTIFINKQPILFKKQ